MKKTEGDITTIFSCTCPYCDEYQDTNHGEHLKTAVSKRNKYWFCEINEDTDNLPVTCSNEDCKKKFLVEKFTHLI